ncbi:TonB-dependent receptor [Comamonas thiooxydans]|uniref:TonB-dependent receptor n=1 Tax=Comamonas thiooxydans TaxID=363952 RepID=UPI000A2D66DD|nr:TonB-dependent receptor [Comamonas thiooxydans]MBN9368678.1 TonB-dependent receptor [Comamonadaceae bacterium]BDR10926.1 TonB-dependent receptor [Comamonas thiooxydans]
MKTIRAALTPIAALLALHSPALMASPETPTPVASGASPKDGVLPEVVVTATRTERQVDEVPASISVLNGSAIATKQRQNVYEALRDFEGLDFVSQPGVAHQVYPTIRGVGGSSAGATTQVLVDGLALDSLVSSVMGRGGLNFTSLLDVERVEVLRGPASALYGPSTVGGVINVIPKRWKGGPGGEFSAAYGSHDTRSIAAAVGTSGEVFDVRLSMHDSRSDGYVATPVENPYGQWDLGPRGWKDRKLGLQVNLRPNKDHELSLGLQQYDTASFSDGGRPNAYQNMDGRSATLAYRHDLSEQTQVKAQLRSTRLKQHYGFDRWSWDGLTQPGVVSVGDLALASRGGRISDSTFFQASIDTRPWTGNQLVAGYAHDTGKHDQWGQPVGGDRWVTGSKSRVDSLFVQDEQVLGQFVLTAGMRYDRIVLSPVTDNGIPVNGKASVDHVVNPRLGVRYHVDDVTSLYASYGTAYLPATNSFKFVQPSTTRVDNPDLKPETSATFEVGVNHRWPSGSLRSSLFQTDYEDKITLATDAGSGLRQWQNIAAVKVVGIELAYQGDLGNGWKPYANFSYTRARDHATPGAVGTQSLRVAPRKFNAGLTYAPSSAWAATLNARYVSGLYFNSLSEAQWASGYTQVDAKLSAKLPALGHQTEVFFAVNNLTGKTYEAFNKGEWTDGRTFTVGLTGRF